MRPLTRAQPPHLSPPLPAHARAPTSSVSVFIIDSGVMTRENSASSADSVAARAFFEASTSIDTGT
eukprot:96674-Chlamydomonas_euryale.AAC.1